MCFLTDLIILDWLCLEAMLLYPENTGTWFITWAKLIAGWCSMLQIKVFTHDLYRLAMIPVDV